ncbi:propionate catabolism operon regulatory protein PrpR [Comamonas sp. GB3 AK4-5]|uniref:propionate catabolism operon regulatory protein PrpR n=1 Tax=Comamonas sp. GB3 AK4-5 TaxID=3231487 RepID=UPI00351DF9B6
MHATTHTTASALPHIVTVGRHRVGRVMQGLAGPWASQVRLSHIGAAFDEAVQAVSALHARQPIDALVAAGASGAWLRERVDMPVAIVEVRGLDLLQALRQARERTSGQAGRVGLVSFGPPSAEVAQFDALFGLGLAQFAYRGPEDAPACVQQLLAAGVEAVVAPGLVADLAEQAGMASVLLYSDAAVRQALQDALLLARQRRAERDRQQRLESVLAQLQDGVAAVDAQGRIRAINAHMAALLGSPAAALHGQQLAQLAPALDMRAALTGEEGNEDVVQLAARTLVVRRAPMREGGQITGALVVCRDPAVIQRADRSLRASQRQRSVGARWQLQDYVGSSPAVERLRALAHTFAASDATVLIQGDSGTGKELLAQGMHRASARASQPFLAVNCAALSESLLESELFGHEEGAFTGARRGGKTGLIEAAHTGTLFLDEIGDMPLALQSRLLRVLQEREVLRVGATVPVPIDVRVMAATHADLAAQVERGQFRRDLFYRLAVLRLQAPTLWARGSADVSMLARSLLARRLGLAGPEALHSGNAAVMTQLLDAVLAHATHHRWPGNVRELDNWVERLLAAHSHLRDAQGQVDTQRLLELFPECATPPPAADSGRLQQAGRQAEQAHLREVLESVQGDQRRACEILGISRATLWRRMKK